MKKILLYILALFLLVANVLAAASLDVPDSVEFYAEQGETVSKTFTIKNNGDVELTGILFNFNPIDPKYSVTFTNTVTELAVGNSATITVNIGVPSDETGSKEIGNILIDAIDANEIISQLSIPLKEHIGGLDIIDLDVKVGKREEALNDLKDADLIKPDYTRPGEPIVFEIDIENLFSEDSENDIKNIRINVIIAEIDGGEDLEEESGDIDLKPEESHRETFEFSIPIELEEDEYDVNIDVEGRDDYGFDREIHWTLKLEAEKESHDIKIHKASLSTTKIICGGTAILSTTIYNFGRNSEDEVKLTIKNSDLGINIKEFPIELESDLLEEESKWSKSFTIPVSKAQKSGTYPLEMWVYFDEEGDVRADYRKLELVVEECVEEKEEPTIVCGNNKVETGEECDDGNKIAGDGCSALCKKEIVEEEEEQITGGTVITETKEEGNNWIYALIGINVLVLIIIIVLIVLMFRGKKPEKGEEVYKNF